MSTNFETAKPTFKRPSNGNNDGMAFPIFVPDNLKVWTTGATLSYLSSDINFLSNNDGFQKKPRFVMPDLIRHIENA